MQATCALLRLCGGGFSALQHSRPLSLQVAPSVAKVLKAGGPVVALESTIITHGMPYPENLRTAEMVEDVVRQQGAVPATVGIVGGKLFVGLSRPQMERLARHEHPCVKTSRRDLACVMAKGLDGGTTVSATLVAATRAGISVFVTGGVGGVHRGGQLTMDVSADLTDLGRSPVCCVCAGVKSILDVGRTLEALETHGVCVVTLGPTDSFPAFFTPDSGFRSPHHVTSCGEAAAVLYQHRQLAMESGVLLAVPIPERHRAEGEAIQAAIDQAVAEVERDGVTGRDVTPLILSRVSQLTSGASLQANIRLVENNALHGARVAVQLAELLKAGPIGKAACLVGIGFSGSDRPSEVTTVGSPLVIGGSVVDLVVKVSEKKIKADGSTHRGRIVQASGGVARNLADALSRLGHQPAFISAVGLDQLGETLLKSNPHMDWQLVERLLSRPTASYVLLVDSVGGVQFGVGDMDIHESVTPELVERHRGRLAVSPLVVMDANPPSATVGRVARLCAAAAVPLWFEPTDVLKAGRATALVDGPQPVLLYASPNVAELRVMLATLTGEHVDGLDSLTGRQLVRQCREASVKLLRHFYCVIATMGIDGVLVSRRGGRTDPLPKAPLSERFELRTSAVSCVHYSVWPAARVVNESGAGDCFNAGFIAGVLAGAGQDECVWMGQQAASQSVTVAAAVPDSLQLPYTPSGLQVTQLL